MRHGSRIAGLAGCALLLAATAAPVALAQGHSGHSGHEADDPHAAHRAAAAGAGGSEGERVQSVEGLTIPDVEVIDQDGETRRFFSDLVEGKTVAMNFVFTTCTTICPPMGANFGRLQRELGDRVGDDVHLISVSVDPATDTPERMRAWGRNFGAGDAGEGWTLVTGNRVEITRLLKALEVFTPDVRDHSPVVLLGSEPSEEWTRAYGLAPPARLAEILNGLAPDADNAPGAHGHGAHGQGEE